MMVRYYHYIKLHYIALHCITLYYIGNGNEFRKQLFQSNRDDGDTVIDHDAADDDSKNDRRNSGGTLRLKETKTDSHRQSQAVNLHSILKKKIIYILLKI